jgi:hypothetical protein
MLGVGSTKDAIRLGPTGLLEETGESGRDADAEQTGPQKVTTGTIREFVFDQHGFVLSMDVFRRKSSSPKPAFAGAKH